MRSSVTIASPDRTITSDLKNVGVNLADTYVTPLSEIKIKLTDNLFCVGTAAQAYGSASTYATGTGIGGSLDKDFAIMNFGVTRKGQWGLRSYSNRKLWAGF